MTTRAAKRAVKNDTISQVDARPQRARRALDPASPARSTKANGNRRSDDAPARRLNFTALLQPPSHLTTTSAIQAEIGIGTISAEDVRETEAWTDRGKPGAGADNLLDLVNFRTWIPAAVTPEGAHARLGPLPLPQAQLYQVLAWTELRSFWWETVAPSSAGDQLDAGVIRPYPATGAWLRITGSQPTYYVRLERVPHDGHTTAPQLLPVIQRVAPELADALLDGSAFEIETAKTYPLFPLLPEPAIRLIFRSRTGIESTATEISLLPNQIIEAEINADALFLPGSFDSVTLDGKLTFGQTQDPLAAAEISLLDANSTSAISDSAGQFRIENLPMLLPLNLQIRTPDFTTTRPILPEIYTVQFDPRGTTTGSVIQREWNIPAFYWLNLPADQMQPVAGESRPPFPIYALQKNDSGIWKDVRADHFVQELGGLSVSINKPGRYRITAMSSPCSVRYSEQAEVSAHNIETTVTLPAGIQREVQLRVLDSRSSDPVLHAQVTLIGPNRSVPPVRGVTNSSGVIPIPVIDECSAVVTVDAAGYKTREVEIALNASQESADVLIEPD